MTRHYLYIWWSVLSVSTVATVTILVFVPESPDWQHEKGEADQYNEARQSLIGIAHFNGVSKIKGKPYGRFKFVREAKNEGMNIQKALEKYSDQSELAPLTMHNSIDE